MASKESRLQRGRRRGIELSTRILADLRTRRVTFDISLRALAEQLGCSPATAWRRESDVLRASVVELSEMASVLGLELSIGLHPVGDPIRDKGQQAVGRRLEAILGQAWQSMDETPLPMPGDQRASDKLLRLRNASTIHRVGVDIETRIRDIQELVRRTRLRERDGGVDEVLIVLSDSATNGRLIDQLREALGSRYATPRRAILRALREGSPLPGSGVVLI